MLVSDCCLSHYTEEPTEIEGKECIFVCATCKEQCKRVPLDPDTGKAPEKGPEPRSADQAYEDAWDTGEGGSKADKPAPDKPESTGLEFKDGLIYQDGKLVGHTLSDAEWFEQEFGAKPTVDAEMLKKIREKSQ